MPWYCEHEKVNRWGNCIRCTHFIGGPGWRGRANWTLISFALIYMSALVGVAMWIKH